MEANETPRRSLSVTVESNKEKDELKDAKNVKEGSSAEKSKENGIRVSENGEEGGKFGDEVGEKKGLEISGDEKVVSLDDDEEMNGVSSLLQIQQSGNSKGLEPVIDAIDKSEERAYEGCDENPDGKIGEVSEGNKDDDLEGHEFKVGDFVWGKIKNHPWWPGRIYDSKDASDYAMKIKAKDRFLVAYFGDGTFAWCSPSQLKPFAENFVEMSGSSCSKNFLIAVGKAVDEFGTLVELEMTCSCVREKNLVGLCRSLVSNAGIKDGVIFPEGGIEKFSTSIFEPVDFVYAMKCIASVASISDVLELSVFKSWLSALYRAKGGYQLPSYYDPQPVPGLEEDDSNQMGEFNGVNGEKEVRIGGPVEEDWHSPQEGSRNDQQGESSLRRCQGGPDDNPHQKVKRKSIAEIMEKHDNAGANKDSKPGKPASSAKSRKRKGGDGSSEQGMDAKEKNEAGDVDKEKATKSESRRKKRKERNEVDVDVEEKIIDVVKAVDSSKSAGKKKKLKGTDEPAGANDSTSKPRTRKASKLGESVAAEKPVSNNEDQNVVSKQTSKRGRKKKESFVVVESDAAEGKDTGKSLESAEKPMDVTGNIQSDYGDEQSEKGFSPRERKKSKYLTFPYTSINRGQRKSEVEAESPKPSGDVLVEKPGTEAANSSVSEPSSVVKSGDEKNQEKASEEPGTANGEPRPPPLNIDLNSVVDPIKVNTPSNEILRGIRSAALSPLSLDKNQSLDVVEDFYSAFRSSIYSDGLIQKSKQGRKRKAEESEPSPMVKEQKQTDNKQGRKQNTEEPEVMPLAKEQKQTDNKRRRKQKTEEPEVTPLAKVLKQTDNKRGRKQKTEESEPMPLAEEQKETDQKRGRKRKTEESELKPLVKVQKQTDVSSAEHRSRNTKVEKSEVSKRGRPKSKEAAAAADENINSKESVKKTLRRGSGVKVQEQNEPADKTHRTKVKKTREIGELSGSKASSRSKGGAKTPNKQSATGGMSQLGYIKQKIEKMSAMLQKSDGKFSPTMKSKLEGEMKGLLEEMNTMISTSP